MTKPTADDIRDYIDRTLEAWKKKPPAAPDRNYEEGHEAAFRELKAYADGTRTSRDLSNKLNIDDPAEVEATLDALTNEEGWLTADVVVDAAKSENHPLHRYFDWGAPRQHNLDLACEIIESVKLSPEGTGALEAKWRGELLH
jgi:hypothetical protein